jgi:hypothetical protein
VVVGDRVGIQLTDQAGGKDSRSRAKRYVATLEGPQGLSSAR